jgi:hypothetical protein
MYYAYGIRNSFGMDFDPVTGNLWDTENGPNFGDEINLIDPGFNSGWSKIQGIWSIDQVIDIDGQRQIEKGEEVDISGQDEEEQDPSLPSDLDDEYDLVNFDGLGKYSHPELAWNVAPTSLIFFHSNRLGEDYENDIFVAGYDNQFLYHFDLNEDRTELSLNGPLEDKIADQEEELEEVIFGEGFYGVTDLEVGPHDGYHTNEIIFLPFQK